MFRTFEFRTTVRWMFLLFLLTYWYQVPTERIVKPWGRKKSNWSSPGRRNFLSMAVLDLLFREPKAKKAPTLFMWRCVFHIRFPVWFAIYTMYTAKLTRPWKLHAGWTCRPSVLHHAITLCAHPSLQTKTGRVKRKLFYEHTGSTALSGYNIAVNK